jgi:hypothetical protein
MSIKVSWVFNLLILVWSLSFLSGFVYAIEPTDETPRIYQAQKPVNCTTDAYDVVKKNINVNYGEVGLMRWISDEQTVVEVLANLNTGTTTILEYLPRSESTCFLSPGKGLEVNTNVLVKPTKGIPTSY